jgi:hypothetical protein
MSTALSLYPMGKPGRGRFVPWGSLGLLAALTAGAAALSTTTTPAVGTPSGVVLGHSRTSSPRAAIRPISPPADAPPGVVIATEVPTKIPASGVAVWSHVVVYFPPNGTLPRKLPSIGQMEADQPKSFPTMAQIEAQEQPAVVLRPLAGHAQVVTPATIRAAVAAMDASPPFSESRPLLVSLTNPGLPSETNVPAYVVVATWPVPVGTYIGCAPSNHPTSCPLAFATHHVLIFNAQTGSFMLGFSTP